MIIAMIFNILSRILVEVDFCLAMNRVYIPNRKNNEKNVAGIHIITQNSQGEFASKAEEKTNHERNVRKTEIVALVNPNNRVVFIF
jgi:hypothetical protein